MGTVVTSDKLTRVEELGPKKVKDMRPAISLATGIYSRRNPADRAILRSCKTKKRNGITFKTALIGGRYGEQATRPDALEGRIAEKANARGNTLDMLTSARWFG